LSSTCASSEKSVSLFSSFSAIIALSPVFGRLAQRQLLQNIEGAVAALLYHLYMRYKYTDEQIIEAVKHSKCILDVMRIIGASTTSGGVHNHISRRIKELGLDTAHFTPYSVEIGGRRNASINLKLAAEKILVRQTSGLRRRTTQLRRAMIEAGIVYECYSCHLSSWQGKPLELEIEHKDGDCLNNQQSNLIFLCPNCHSQTATYCRRKQ
jgi:hypothetical protein